MIKQIQYPPECMAKMAWICKDYFELSNNDGVYGYVALICNPPECQIHFQVVRFAKSVYKSMIEVWPSVLDIIKGMGGEIISVCYPYVGDMRMYKLLAKFGFLEPRTHWISFRRV